MKYLLFVDFVLTAFMGFLQEDKFLPKGFTENEKWIGFRISIYKQSHYPTTFRAVAEWEEVEYLLVTWKPNFQNILRQIVAVGITECNVIITTENQASVENHFTADGIDLTNITFLDVPWDSIWIRDYAGNTIYSNDVGERALTDWIYDRPRPNDDVTPSSRAA